MGGGGGYCYVVIFFPWSNSLRNVVKTICGQVCAVPFHVGLITLPPKTQTHIWYYSNISENRSVITGNAGPLLFSLPITTIGSSFTRARGKKKHKIGDSYNNTAWARLNSIAKLIWCPKTFFKKHTFPHCHGLAPWALSFHARWLWKCRRMPQWCHVICSVHLCFPPDTTSARTSTTEAQSGAILRSSWKRWRGITGFLQWLKSRLD